MYFSVKDREKLDMEADRLSLYTDFHDIAYNTLFKRREIVGFDENGNPLIEHVYQNGDINQHLTNADVSVKGRDSTMTSKCTAFEHDDSDTIVNPCSYDPCVNAWDETFTRPYQYPDIENWDFPKIDKLVRFRIPGKCHLQNSYPLDQFGLQPQFKTRSRRTLPLPANIPIPKRLPQLMYRAPEKISLIEAMKNKFGIKVNVSRDIEGDKGGKENLINNEEENNDHPPPLPISSQFRKAMGMDKEAKHPSDHNSEETPRPKAQHSLPWPKIRSSSKRERHPSPTRQVGEISTKEKPSPNIFTDQPVKNIHMTHMSVLPSIKTTSSIFHEHCQEDDAWRPKTSHKRLVSARSPHFHVGFDTKISSEEFQRPKTSLATFAPRSALKVRDVERPETSLATGRKSVTIRENDIDSIQRPLTSGHSLRPTSVTPFTPSLPPTPRPSTAEPLSIPRREKKRPMTDAVSALETIVAPHSARPIKCTPLPKELTDTYRPISVGHNRRPITPVEHPRPTMHSGVIFKTMSEYGPFRPDQLRDRDDRLDTYRHDYEDHFVTPPPFVRTPQNAAMTNGRRTSYGNSTSTRHMDESEDDADDYTGTFFLTEFHDNDRSSAPSGTELRRKKKSSPPPIYSEASNDRVIERSTPRDNN